MSASIYLSRWVHFSGGRAVGVGEFQIRAAQDEFVEDGPIGECAAGGILLTGVSMWGGISATSWLHRGSMMKDGMAGTNTSRRVSYET